MSGKKENLEGFIKFKLEEKKYTYDERLWTPVGTVLLEEKKKRRRRWLVLFPILLGLGLASTFFLESNKGTSENDMAVVINKYETDPISTALDENVKPPKKEQSIIKENELKNNESGNSLFDKSKKTEKENAQIDKNLVFKNKTDRTIFFSKIKKASQKTEASILEDEFPGMNETNTFTENITPDLPEGNFDKNKTGISTPSLIQPLPIGLIDLPEIKPTIISQKIDPVKKADIRLPEGWQLFASVGIPLPDNSFGGNRASIGFGHVYRFAPRWSATAAVGYRAYWGNNESVEFDKTTYDFVRESDHYKLLLSKIHYVNLYSGLGYQLAPRHVFSFGVDFSRFITAHGELETRKERALEIEPYSTVSSGTGYREAFRQWNVELQLGYQYILSHRTTLGIGVRHPFKSILKMEYQNNGPKPLAYGHLFLTHQLRK